MRTGLKKTAQFVHSAVKLSSLTAPLFGSQLEALKWPLFCWCVVKKLLVVFSAETSRGDHRRWQRSCYSRYPS